MSKFPVATFRIELGPEKRLGPGKVRLLELIGETGSISAAARAMKMSYRRAWLLIEEANGLFGAALVESSTGGAGGGGARVTALGLEVIAAYRALESDVNGLVEMRLGNFPGIRRRAASARRSKRT
jgi:molybdate transport system regulatory protein